MTEDDTYRKLVQMPYEELEKEYTEYWYSVPKGVTTAKVTAWLRERGWGYNEWQDRREKKIRSGR